MGRDEGPQQAAVQGFGRSAEAYDRGRPSYPPEAVARLAEAVGLGPGARVVDVGAGTGKLTRLLVPTGARIVAVEPVAAMRERLPGSVTALDGTAERVPLPDRSVDAVVAGQAFHWFRGREALAEFARVLRPGGRLGLIWNARDDRVGWVAELTSVIDPYQGDTPRYAQMTWRSAFDDQPWFGPLRQAAFTHEHLLPVPAMVDRFASISFIAALNEGDRVTVLRDVEAILTRAADRHGVVSMPYRTDVFWTGRDGG